LPVGVVTPAVLSAAAMEGLFMSLARSASARARARVAR
jgi:hypothetical protein